MARKSLTGQLNMFDLLKGLDDAPMGEVEMVSLMPWEEPEPAPVEEPVPEPVEEPAPVEEPVSEPVEEPALEEEPAPVVKKTRKPRTKKVSKEVEEAPPKPPTPIFATQADISKDRPVMCRKYEIDGKQLEIAYINYNKVQITREGQEPELYVFESSKEAVDYYVQKMQELEPEE